MPDNETPLRVLTKALADKMKANLEQHTQDYEAFDDEEDKRYSKVKPSKYVKVEDKEPEGPKNELPR